MSLLYDVYSERDNEFKITRTSFSNKHILALFALTITFDRDRDQLNPTNLIESMEIRAKIETMGMKSNIKSIPKVRCWNVCLCFFFRSHYIDN